MPVSTQFRSYHHKKGQELVKLSLMSIFNTNMAIRVKRSGVESYPYTVKEGQRYINLNPGCLFRTGIMHVKI